jgi:nucleotide-binding universal stress UspA family protein
MSDPVGTTRILAAVDDSDAAAPILEVSRWLAERLGQRVDAVHVREDGETPTLETAATATGAHVRVLDGRPAPTLADELAASDVSMAVLGARDLPAGPQPAGHVTTHLLLHTRKPIVVVPPERRLGDRIPDRVLVPLDGTEETAAALAPLAQLLDEAGLEITILHVFDRTTSPRFWDHRTHTSRDWAREFLARFSPCNASVSLRVGRPVEQVLDVSSTDGVGLILLAWSQSLVPGRAATVREALSRTAVPVMLVPSGARNGGTPDPAHRDPPGARLRPGEEGGPVELRAYLGDRLWAREVYETEATAADAAVQWAELGASGVEIDDLSIRHRPDEVLEPGREIDAVVPDDRPLTDR